MAEQRFDGRRAIVTGSAHGIGLAIATRLASEGARVAMLDIDRARLTEASSGLRAGDLDVIAIPADVADPESCAEAIAAATGELDGVDVLCNNAGRLRAGTVAQGDLEEWDRTFAVNVRAMFLTSRLVVPTMLAQGSGVIVNTASTSGMVGEAGISAYNSSKGAVIQFTRQLAAEYSREGLRANCVCPGWIPTGFNDPMLAGLSDAEVQAMVDATVPAGRQGTPEEIAAAVCFLASADASYITGHALVVDGGLTACR